eukprot:6695396-Prymnesium_polylepis.1
MIRRSVASVTVCLAHQVQERAAKNAAPPRHHLSPPMRAGVVFPRSGPARLLQNTKRCQYGRQGHTPVATWRGPAGLQHVHGHHADQTHVQIGQWPDVAINHLPVARLVTS